MIYAADSPQPTFQNVPLTRLRLEQRELRHCSENRVTERRVANFLGEMNVNVERFNRTLQEEFIDYHEELLTSPDQFNRKLIP